MNIKTSGISSYPKVQFEVQQAIQERLLLLVYLYQAIVLTQKPVKSTRGVNIFGCNTNVPIYAQLCFFNGLLYLIK